MSTTKNHTPGKKCRLCLQSGNLKNSHIIPRFIYKRIRGEHNNGKSRKLTKISDTGEFVDAALCSSQQREPMLCGRCEQRFGDEEKYASSVINVGFAWAVKDKGRILRNPNSGRVSYIVPISETSIDAQRFVYFASSILWRSAVAKRLDKRPNMGPKHKEEFRRYLNGMTDFPNKATLNLAVAFSTSNTLSNRMSSFVASTRQFGFLRHSFSITSFHFDLCIGRNVPPHIKEFCIYRGSHPSLLLASEGDLGLFRNMADMVSESVPRGKLAHKRT